MTLQFLLIAHAAQISAVVLVSVAFVGMLRGPLGRLIRLFFPPSESGREAEAQDALSDEIVAVIAAAVATVLASPHRIVHIRGLTSEQLGWLWGGRMEHHASHRDIHRPHH